MKCGKDVNKKMDIKKKKPLIYYIWKIPIKYPYNPKYSKITFIIEFLLESNYFSYILHIFVNIDILYHT